MFRRLSVFAGGFTLEAAESVCAGEDLERDEVLESALAPGGQVAGDGAGTGWRGTLPSAGDGAAVRGGEARRVGRNEVRSGTARGYYLALAEEAEPELKGERQVAWLERLEPEHDNLRAALRGRWSRGDVGARLRLGWALWLFWGIRAHFAEGRRSMEQALSAKGSDDMPASFRAKALFVEGTMANYQGDHGRRNRCWRKACGLVQGTGGQAGIAYALSSAGFAANGQGRHERGIALTRRVCGSLPRGGGEVGRRHRARFPAVAWRDRGDHGRAKAWRSEDWRCPERWARGNRICARSIPWRPWRRPSATTSARGIFSRRG